LIEKAVHGKCRQGDFSLRMNFSLGKRAGMRYLQEKMLLFAACGMEIVGLRMEFWTPK